MGAHSHPFCPSGLDTPICNPGVNSSWTWMAPAPWRPQDFNPQHPRLMLAPVPLQVMDFSTGNLSASLSLAPLVSHSLISSMPSVCSEPRTKWRGQPLSLLKPETAQDYQGCHQPQFRHVTTSRVDKFHSKMNKTPKAFLRSL